MLATGRWADELLHSQSPLLTGKPTLNAHNELEPQRQQKATQQQSAKATGNELVRVDQPAPHQRPANGAETVSPLARKLVNPGQRKQSSSSFGHSEPSFLLPHHKKPGHHLQEDAPQAEALENQESDSEHECQEADQLLAGSGQKRASEAEQQQEKKNKKSQEAKEEKKRAHLARHESIFEREDNQGKQSRSRRNSQKQRQDRDRDRDEDPHRAESACCCSRMLQFVRARKCLTIPVILLVIYCAAIYCLPFIEIDPKIPNELPAIPFDFHEGPLKPSSASAFKFKHLFRGRLSGPESLAFDSDGNLYTAIEGGFVLYARLNESSPIKKFLLASGGESSAYMAPSRSAANFKETWRQARSDNDNQQRVPELVKIAELNGLRHGPGSRSRSQRADEFGSSGSWRRECQLDEKIYGPQLFTTTASETEDRASQDRPTAGANFKTNVRISRCSKPLGLRLSHDESSLYVIDTLTGLYRVNLRAAEKPHSGGGGGHSAAASQRQLVTKLVDFKANQGQQVLPAIQLEDEGPEGYSVSESGEPTLKATRLMNVSLKAVDDLTLDRRGDHDLIYMTVASQTWPATAFVYDMLEGRPSGLILRFDTSNSQLVVLEPRRVALVRTSALMSNDVDDQEARPRKPLNKSLLAGRQHLHQPSLLLGAPRLDEDDIFDDRPLNFPNGLELTDDRQALLIADTSNKRIIRHYVRGPRRGTSDLWAWTPMFPDNIRRGYDRARETYWVVGCGRVSPSAAQSPDFLATLRTWPRLRKFLMKNLYFLGYTVEFMGANLLGSNRIQDVGYELRTGSSLCSNGCPGMMIIQYNQHGDVIRSIHSREFPNDLSYYSQVNELIDPNTGEHVLYLGSPSYDYLTKLVLPAESQV